MRDDYIPNHRAPAISHWCEEVGSRVYCPRPECPYCETGGTRYEGRVGER